MINSKLQTANYKLQNTNNKLHITHDKLHTAKYTIQTNIQNAIQTAEYK